MSDLSVVPREKWVADKDAGQCMLCEATFTCTDRRHHCRYCGRVVCGKCSTQLIGAERACDECYTRSTTTTATPTTTTAPPADDNKASEAVVVASNPPAAKEQEDQTAAKEQEDQKADECATESAEKEDDALPAPSEALAPAPLPDTVLYDKLAAVAAEVAEGKAMLYPECVDMTALQLAACHLLFEHYDKDNDGQLSQDDITGCFAEGVPEGFDVIAFISQYDRSGSGTLDTKEFFVYLWEFIQQEAPAAREQFDGMDIDGNAYVEAAEIVTSMGLPEEQVAAMIQQADSDGDGRVSFEEFEVMMLSGGPWQ